MTHPLIGLPGRRKVGRQVDGFEGTLENLEIDMYLADYTRGLIEAGGLPVHIPMDVDPESIIEHLDGVLLTGGADIDPARYGAEPDPDLAAVEDERDALEIALYHAAVARGTPVLGICRGLQVINVCHGGTLEQHVPAHSRFDTSPYEPVHQVQIEPGSRAHQIYGASVEVNSLHHQTVADLGEGLTITGRSTDGEVEVLEGGDGVLAVQWHPEMMRSRATDPCFVWLVERAGAGS
ncbi:MAG: gamma-glutamyl-gamma-aminobutyrate hydrolase family protein [Actinomycetia bacterium]|nr:gamma-glutamyl-gamma-aminobutyrate hydrolase family protein [Actinomycetes bacterium]MCP4960020.1 gamma-glutamyl-gamma-aminobutyrate hydrolase family protein [Actinomycetes bacterium]